MLWEGIAYCVLAGWMGEEWSGCGGAKKLVAVQCESIYVGPRGEGSSGLGCWVLPIAEGIGGCESM